MLKLRNVNPKFPLTYENLANIYITQKKYQESLLNYEKALEINKLLSRNGLHNLAWLYGQLGNYDKSIELYKNILEAESDNYLVMNNIGTGYIKLSNAIAARKYYLKGVAVYKQKFFKQNIQNSVQLFYNLGRLAVDNKEILLIEELTEDILKLDPDNDFSKYLKWSIDLINENYSNAQKLFEELINKNVDIPELYIAYSFILSSIDKDFDKSINILESAMKKGFTHILIDNNLAFSYINKGDFEKANEILSKYNDEMPTIILATKGLLEIRLGNIDVGEKFYDQAIEKIKDTNLNKLLKQILSFEKAKYYYKQVDINISKKLLNKAIGYGKTYLNPDIMNLQNDLFKNSEDN